MLYINICIYIYIYICVSIYSLIGHLFTLLATPHSAPRCSSTPHSAPRCSSGLLEGEGVVNLRHRNVHCVHCCDGADRFSAAPFSDLVIERTVDTLSGIPNHARPAIVFTVFHGFSSNRHAARPTEVTRSHGGNEEPRRATRSHGEPY